ncbi:unnamed protein product, partial [marine sediment metagenome]
ADEFGACQAFDVMCTLFNDQFVNRHKIGGAESYLAEQQIDSIQPKCYFVF